MHRWLTYSLAFHLKWLNYSLAFTLILRAKDFYAWGYKDLAQKCAISLLVKYGWKDPEIKPFVDMVKEIGKTPECFPWRHKALLQLFKVSPALFDAVCLAAGERIK